jgi:hypothetical protein
MRGFPSNSSFQIKGTAAMTTGGGVKTPYKKI